MSIKAPTKIATQLFLVNILGATLKGLGWILLFLSGVMLVHLMDFVVRRYFVQEIG